MATTVGVVRESAAGERRVALTPDVAKKLKGRGADLLMESGAGVAASFPTQRIKMSRRPTRATFCPAATFC